MMTTKHLEELIEHLERATFEEWYAKNNIVDDLNTWTDSSNMYGNYTTQFMWQDWQARASLER